MQKTSIFLAGLASMLVLASGAPVHAQFGEMRGPDGARGQRVERDGESREAYDNGYRRGIERGERAARASRRVESYRDERDYRNGDWGYHNRFGSRGSYRLSFRLGFEAGFTSGFGRYGGAYGRRAVPRYRPGAGGYGTSGGYGSYGRHGYGDDVAFRNGYRDGLEKGDKDARKGRSYDVLRHGWYRGGDRHYDHDYGPREYYRQAYREGFQQGYDAGYRRRW